MRFAAGQRWISEPEPELGLGLVLGTEPGRVKMFFPASNAMRIYAEAAAPLRRVRFKVGDTVHSHEGSRFTVAVVHERCDGILTYAGENEADRLLETQLNDTLTWDKPGDRIAGGQIDDVALWALRQRALDVQHRLLASPVHGFCGARIDLIPHQLAIAQEVAARQRPRVLLADEVGLGKTIEACLILHRLHLTGKAARALVLVPEALVHQWFVELFRRFNLRFAIFDEQRCAAIEEHNPEANPFLDDQLVLAPLGWLAHHEKRRRQVAEAGWDLLVVDEAHHLAWSPENASPEYQLVETLGAAAPGLLLLTATPQQLGAESHFARLRLLDPERFSDLARFLAEQKDYAPVAQIAGKLADGKKLLAKETARLAAMPGRIAELAAALTAAEKPAAKTTAKSTAKNAKGAKKKKGGEEDAVAEVTPEPAQNEAPAAPADAARAIRQQLLDALIDQHGVGRVLFRNTRAELTGFPKRTVKLAPLKGDADAVERARQEFLEGRCPLEGDPRVAWLLAFLKKLKGEKALLICRTREKAEALEAALRAESSVDTALFHEGLTLLQRDRNAAWFAEEEEGAQLLICSEIGSEGRNFQFAHHLVLFDLPENPELLEQRIGRLDRIGQSADIQLHVPYIKGGPFETLARWFHEGLNAFAESLHGGAELYERFCEPVRAIALGATGAEIADENADENAAKPAKKSAAKKAVAKPAKASKSAKSTKSATAKKSDKGDAAAASAALDALIAETQAVHETIRARLAEGEDRLLALQNRRNNASVEAHSNGATEDEASDASASASAAATSANADSISLPEGSPSLAAPPITLGDLIRAADADTSLDDFLLTAFDHFGASVEEIAPRTWIVQPGAELGDGLPGIPREGLTLTADRQRALAREDVSFLSGDHPAVRGVLELLLGGIHGNAAIALLRQPGGDALFLEATHILETVAPAELHAGRFLPPTPIRVVIDNKLAEQKRPLSAAANGPMNKVIGKTDLCHRLMPKMLDAAAKIAQQRSTQKVAAALEMLAKIVGTEVARLKDLRAANPENPALSDPALAAAETEYYDLRDRLSDARLRLDSVRLVFRTTGGAAKEEGGK